MATLWHKAIVEVRWQLAGSTVIMFAFHWIRVWITSLFPIARFQKLLTLVPDVFMPLLPVPKEQMATVAGRIAIAYDDPLPMMVLLAWAIGRGSDAVSGELGRGTLEMTLAQPVRRISVIGTQAAVTVLGAIVISIAGWGGTFMGLLTVELEQPTSSSVFIPAAINVFAMTFFMAGLATLVSAFDRFRSRTIGVLSAFFVVELLAKVVGLVGEKLHWLLKATFLTLFEPQLFVADPNFAWAFTLPTATAWRWSGLSYQALLFGLGCLFYGVAISHFCRRDLPAPL